MYKRIKQMGNMPKESSSSAGGVRVCGDRGHQQGLGLGSGSSWCSGKKLVTKDEDS